MRFLTHKLFVVLPFVFMIGSSSSFASHLVGGDITYTYTGTPNVFTLKVTLYRDKTSTTTFESYIYVGIYDKVTNAYAGYAYMGPPVLTTLTLGTPCYTPSLQIERAVYTLNVNIPSNANGYYLSYIRCCRNGSIVNIVNPSSEGWLAYCEMPNPALGNSSPSFTTNPDGYMCRNYLNNDQGFSATDANGDVLVYSFSTPLSCSALGQCSSISPDPGYVAGPYGNITWVGGYSTANPLGDPGMVINSSTGAISTTPPNTGVYVFCVKVEEYRAGVKIGEIRRDFQFDVLNSCNVVNITANPGNPTCQGTQTTLTATGVPSGFTYSWNPGGAATSAIVINPGSAGTYNYTVTATNGLGCTYTATSAQVINANPSPSVSSAGNPCLGQTMTLTASGGTSYSWSNGFLTAAMSTAAQGTYTVWATNASNCSASTTGVITGAPVTASTYTWTGAGSTANNNWFDPANWSGGAGACLPTCSKNVLIPIASSWSNPSNSPDIGTASGSASCNSITINQGGKLSFSSATSQLDICGDFVDHGVILTFPANGVLNFIGTVAQNFTKSNTASGNDLNKIILNNTATAPSLTVKEGAGYKDLSLGSTGTFVFQSGVLITEGSRMLVIKNTSSTAISGHGTSKYVYGRIRRYVTNNTAYDFPVGGNPSGTTVYPYQLMNVNFTSITGLTYLTACFDNPSNATGALTGNGLPITEQTGQYDLLIDNGGPNTGVGFPTSPGTVAGIWTAIPDAGTATYNLTLYGRNFDNSVGAGSYYSILKRNTYSMCSPIPSWTLDGILASNSLTGNVITASRTGMIGYSQFAIAKHTTPLPVELVLFDAACSGQNTILSWVTASEQNNDFFTLERSCDENFLQYQTIGMLQGAGNSSTLREYSFTDYDAMIGDCYYRLSQTDFDGTTVAFTPLSINCKENAAFNFIGILPNPALDVVNVLFTSISANMVYINVTDMMGKNILSKEVLPEIGLNKVELHIGDFSGGVYFMNLDNGSRSFVKKIVKKD